MSEYISLQEATSACPYSQEYLSLRARQGKLQAIKLGRNWFTTLHWLQEYITKSDNYKKLLAQKNSVCLKPGFKQEEAALQTIEPPRNLPVHAPDADIWEENTSEDLARQDSFARKLQFALATSLVGMLFFVGVFLGQLQVLRVAEKVNPIVFASAFSLRDAIQTKGFVTGAGIGEIAQGYAGWLGQQIRSIAQIFTPEQIKQGLVVVPSENDGEELKTQIQQSFSDEVTVTPYDEESGIITPVFRKRVGEDYLYILVPLRERR